MHFCGGFGSGVRLVSILDVDFTPIAALPDAAHTLELKLSGSGSRNDRYDYEGKAPDSISRPIGADDAGQRVAQGIGHAEALPLGAR